MNSVMLHPTRRHAEPGKDIHDMPQSTADANRRQRTARSPCATARPARRSRENRWGILV